MDSLSKKLIYLPFETKSREFESKSLISLLLAQKGFGVVLYANNSFIPKNPGVILLKSAAEFEFNSIARFKQIGVKCIVLDEEGLVQTNNEKQWALRLSEKTISLVDKFLFNGNAEKDVLEKYYSGIRNKGIVTGNVRFDFYKPLLNKYFKKQADKYKKKYGKYILLPSRFGNVAPAFSSNYIEYISKNFNVADADLSIYQNFYQHSKNVYEEFLNLLPELSAKFRDYSIVVRPHPSESHSPWINAARKLSNVYVNAEGSIGPWLLGSEAVLHNGCTTGLEAYLMEKPVFTYMPYVSAEYDLELPNSVSVKCYEKSELLTKLYECLNNINQDGKYQDKSKFASYYLHNIGANYAFNQVAEEIEKESDGLPKINLVNLKFDTDMRVDAYKKILYISVAHMVHKLGLYMPLFLKDIFYRWQKNPGFSMAEFKKMTTQFEDVLKIEDKKTIIKKLGPDVVLIYKL